MQHALVWATRWLDCFLPRQEQRMDKRISKAIDSSKRKVTFIGYTYFKDKIYSDDNKDKRKDDDMNRKTNSKNKGWQLICMR